MTSISLTSGNVMDASAALMNDSAKSVYTYVAQLPYLNLALQELQEIFELNDVPVTADFSAVITLPASTTSLSFGGVSPKLPDDLIEPQILWERATGIDPYTPMTRVDSLPETMTGVEISQFQIYVWEANQIRLFPANQINDIRMNYTRSLFTRFTDVTGADPIAVINAASFLEYRNAALCSQFIGENSTRAQALDGDAGLALERSLGISAKGRQSIMTRRRPFRSSYKRRSYK